MEPGRFAVIFASFARLIGRTLRAGAQRVLVQDAHAHLDRTRVRFLLKM
jgi:hypothetical protein